MSFDGNGNYLRIHNWTADAANGIDINASEMDGEDNSIAGALSICVTRDGQGKMAADFLPATDNAYALGSGARRWSSINGVPIASIVSGIYYAQTPAEAAAGVTPTVFTNPPGQIDRYFVNTIPGTTDASAGFTAAYAQAQQVGGAVMTVSSLLAITNNVTLALPGIGSQVPSLRIVQGSISIGTGKVLTINCPFSAPEGAQVFLNAVAAQGAVVFGEGTVKEAYFEWWGARPDYSAGTGTDCTAAILAALTACALGNLTIGIIPLRLRSGYYLTGSQTGSLCPATIIRGTGRMDCGFVCKPGTTGIWWSESAAGAAKIVLEDFAFYGNSVAGLTWGLKLGYANVNSPHGTEGYLRGIWVRDVPAGIACDIKGNVGFYDKLSIWNSLSLLSITGSGNFLKDIAVIGGGNGGTSVLLNGANVQGMEIEAPATGNLPLSIQANCAINGLYLSGADGTTLDHWIEFGASATTWAIEALTYYFGTAATTTVTSGNMKRSDGTFFGSNATGTGSGGTSSHAGEGNFFSEVQGQRFQSFTVRLINTAGTLQHRICDAFGVAVNCASLVNGATAALTNTPTGTDASTAFAAGAKISTAQTNVIILDVPNQRIADFAGACGECFSTNGTALCVLASYQSFNVNGTTRNRLNFSFFNKTTGAAFALTTGNIGAGFLVQVQFAGYLAP